MRDVETDAFVLEPQNVTHADRMFLVLSDPAIYEHENAPPPSLEWLRHRFEKLETRTSADGREQWLNWVIRLPTGELIGYVQATVHPEGRAAIAYVLSSVHWGRGLAFRAVAAMMAELVEHYGVRSFVAVLKATNRRSARLLERLGFSIGSPDEHVIHHVESDEILMQRNDERRR